MASDIASKAVEGPVPRVQAQARSQGRLLFVDNIRIFLTLLVILHHLMIIYAGSGSWIYNEGRQDEISNALGGWFCAVNQAYFMGLFLFVAAYFVPGSYDRKGPLRFVKDRLIRLGIPLVVYGWVVRPLFVYYVLHAGQGWRLWSWYRYTYFRVYGLIGGGPLWFIEALLLFSLVYALVRVLTSRRPPRPVQEASFPSSGRIALFALLLGAVTFLVRLVFLVDVSFRPLNLQFANFCQYIALFVAGLVAYRRNWLLALPDKVGRLWLRIALTLILLYPPLALLAGATKDVAPFGGGWHWQSLLNAEWQAFVCVGMCAGLIYLFRRRWNHQGVLAGLLSRAAYTAYLIHEPVITALAVLAIGVALYPLAKFVVASLVAVPLCFGLSILIRKLPYADRVL